MRDRKRMTRALSLLILFGAMGVLGLSPVRAAQELLSACTTPIGRSYCPPRAGSYLHLSSGRTLVVLPLLHNAGGVRVGFLDPAKHGLVPDYWEEREVPYFCRDGRVIWITKRFGMVRGDLRDPLAVWEVLQPANSDGWMYLEAASIAACGNPPDLPGGNRRWARLQWRTDKPCASVPCAPTPPCATPPYTPAAKPPCEAPPPCIAKPPCPAPAVEETCEEEATELSLCEEATQLRLKQDVPCGIRPRAQLIGAQPITYGTKEVSRGSWVPGVSAYVSSQGRRRNRRPHPGTPPVITPPATGNPCPPGQVTPPPPQDVPTGHGNGAERPSAGAPGAGAPPVKPGQGPLTGVGGTPVSLLP